MRLTGEQVAELIAEAIYKYKTLPQSSPHLPNKYLVLDVPEPLINNQI